VLISLADSPDEAQRKASCREVIPTLSCENARFISVRLLAQLLLDHIPDLRSRSRPAEPRDQKRITAKRAMSIASARLLRKDRGMTWTDLAAVKPVNECSATV
jgi:hypothetical protein